MKETKINRKLEYIIIILIIMLLFCVSNCIDIGPISQPKFLGLFFTAILAYLFYKKRLKLRDFKRKSFNAIIAIGFTLVSIVSLCSIILNKSLSITNLFEIIRPIIYLISLLVFITIFKDEKNKSFFNVAFLVLILILFITGIVQFYNFENINDVYIKTIAPTQYVPLVNNYPLPRIVGFLSNPNVYGYILALFNTYLLYLLFIDHNKCNKILLIMAILMIHILLFLTGSRTSYIVLIVSEFTLILLNAILNKKIKKSFMIFLVLFLTELALILFLPYKYNWRIKQIFTGYINTWEMRKESSDIIINQFLEKENVEVKKTTTENANNKHYSEEYKENTNKIINNRQSNKIKKVIIGVGPLKEKITFENEWIKIFVFYGILGIISFISIFTLPLLKLKKMNKNFITFYFTACLSCFVYMIAAGVFFSYNLFISLLLFIGVSYSEKKT